MTPLCAKRASANRVLTSPTTTNAWADCLVARPEAASIFSAVFKDEYASISVTANIAEKQPISCRGIVSRMAIMSCRCHVSYRPFPSFVLKARSVLAHLPGRAPQWTFHGPLRNTSVNRSATRDYGAK
jgi:hypothetical protein